MYGFVKKGLLLPLAAGSLMAGGAGTAAAADSATAEGTAADSPGAVSGNVAQVPVDVPIAVCGDAVAASGIETEAEDNGCFSDDTTAKAFGAAADSPGLISGNVAQVPVNAPVEVCGDAVGILAYGTSAEHNLCVNG
jgi:hypothetical protein